MLMEFTIVLPNGDHKRERIECTDEQDGIRKLEAKHGPGTVPYGGKVVFQGTNR